jgi:hypothetical protein
LPVSEPFIHSDPRCLLESIAEQSTKLMGSTRLRADYDFVMS